MTTRALFSSDHHVDIEGNAADDLKSLWSKLDFDVALFAGDVRAPGHKALEWIADANPHTLSIYSAGNHDFYSFFDKNRPELKTTYERERDAMRRRAEQLGIIFLDNDSYILPDGTRILGGTGWTDFMLRPSWLMYGDAVRGATGAGGMNDYRCIKREPKPGHRIKPIEPKHTVGAHVEWRRWLQRQLAIPHDGDTIVMSHHAPHPKSLLHRRAVDALDCCYASDLTPILTGENAPALWFHGHIHSNRDYEVAGCRVIANPRGYPGHRPSDSRENPAFNPELVIEIGRPLMPMPGM